MTCSGTHITVQGVEYCIKFPPGAGLPPAKGDVVIAEVRRWLENRASGPGCTAPATTSAITPPKLNGPELSFDITVQNEQILMGIMPPDGRPSTNEVQFYRLPLTRDWNPYSADKMNQGLDPAFEQAKKLFLKHREEDKAAAAAAAAAATAGAASEEVEAKQSSELETESKQRQVRITLQSEGDQRLPMLNATRSNQEQGSSRSKGALEVNLDGSPTVVRNKYLTELLKDPLLKFSSACDADTAFDALEQGKTVMVDWQDSNDGDRIEDSSSVLDWVRIVPRVKPDDLVYFITDAGRLSSHLPDYASGPSNESKTITRPAVLFEEQRHELRNAVLGEGWPCQVVEGKIVVELFGQILHLDQTHIQPKSVHNSANARLKLRPISPNFKCQPMAATAEASWVINRYEVTFEYGRVCRRYEPFAVQIDSNWRDLFAPLAEALTVTLGNDKDGRLFYSRPRGPGAEAELIRQIHVRLYDGGARFPMERLSPGWGEYCLPGGPAAYSRYGTHKMRHIDISDDELLTEKRQLMAGPELQHEGKWDFLMDGRVSSETDILDGLRFAMLRPRQQGEATCTMSPQVDSR